MHGHNSNGVCAWLPWLVVGIELHRGSKSQNPSNKLYTLNHIRVPIIN